MTARADPTEIRRALAAIIEPGQATELRAFDGSRIYSGYFDDLDILAQVAADAARWAKGVYIVPNPIAPELLARATNRARFIKRDPTTSDSDIVSRRWLLIDCDPRRASGISSTDAEHDAALAKIQVIRQALAADGWPEPIVADSGNGAHLMYRVDLPANDNGLIRRCLEALAFRFDDSADE